MNKIFFIVGNPRSGKTLLQSLLKFHPSIGWFSQYNARLPQASLLALLNRIYDFSFGQKLLGSNHWLLPRPAELSKKIISTLEKNGSLDESDVLLNEAIVLRKIFTRQAKLLGKDILMVDEGRPARIQYFNKIFPKSYFIHVVRDGRDVVSDLLETRLSWFPEKKSLNDIYPKGVLSLKNEFETWKNEPHKQLILASFRWKAAIYEIERQRKTLLKSRFLTIRYEDLVKNPAKIFREVTNFLSLNGSSEFSTQIKSESFQRFHRRKVTFTNDEKKVLNRLLKAELTRYNYLHDEL